MNNTNGKFFDKIYPAICQILCIYIFFILFFFISRSVFVLAFGEDELWAEKTNIASAFFMGFRFDTVITLYCLLPLILVSGISLFLKNPFNKLKIVLTTVFFVTLLISTIINFYYYKFFQDNINILFFGLFEDDTEAVLTSVWTDYPFVMLSFLIIGVSYLAYCYFNKVFNARFKIPECPLVFKISIVTVFLFLLVLGIRGRLTVFPLKSEDKIICHHFFINRIPGNGGFDLINAYLRKKAYTVKAENPEEVVKKYGFSSAHEAISIYINRPVKNNPDSLTNALKVRTPHNEFLAKNPPNVVVFLCESMSMYFMSLQDDANFNLLGELKDVLPHSYLFDHILQSTGGTIDALENLIINNYHSNVSQSNFYNTSFEGATARPFYNAGYDICFFTSARLGWRNLNNFLPHQYFQQTAGSETIRQKYAGCPEKTWGIYDEYLFDYVFEQLSGKKRNKPAFIFALTSTNHTPYEMPDIDYPDLTLLSDDINTDEEIALKAFRTFRYTNDCIGKFIKKIKASPLHENTIVVVTGDHNARGIFNYGDSEKLSKHGVPLLFFLPEKYKPSAEINIHCFGSHKDVFPTIYNIALSDATYLKTGINLFNKDESETNFGISEFTMVFDRNGYMQLNNVTAGMGWSPDRKDMLIPAPPSPSFEKSNKKMNAFMASMVYFMGMNLWKNKR